ncbi:MAG: hypothetical protein R2883_04420 [Caldisericia bacterium]
MGEGVQKSAANANWVHAMYPMIDESYLTLYLGELNVSTLTQKHIVDKIDKETGELVDQKIKEIKISYESPATGDLILYTFNPNMELR